METDSRWLRLADGERTYRFRHDVVPVVNQADLAIELIDGRARDLASLPAKDRAKLQVMDQLRAEMAKARDLAKAGFEKLGDQPNRTETVEASRQAGREYMSAIIELINHYEQIFDGEAVWPKKAPDEIWTRFNKARAAWRSSH
jgi:hypothetical protein